MIIALFFGGTVDFRQEANHVYLTPIFEYVYLFSISKPYLANSNKIKQLIKKNYVELVLGHKTIYELQH